VSPGRYVNAFFGFSLTLPPTEGIRDLTLPSRDEYHFLYGAQVNLNGLTALTMTARPASNASREDARKAVAGPEGSNPKPITIGGKEFWKGASQKKSSAGKMQTVRYAAAINGYVLEIVLLSFDSELTKQLQQSIESITFFDPTKAAEIAGPSSVLSPAAAALQAPVSHIGQLDPGGISGDVYSNEMLGFSYQFPHGWSITDKATQQKVVETGHQAAWGDSPTAAREHEEAEKCERTLLWANEYPEGTKTEGVNSLVVVSAFDPGCLRGFKFPASLDDKESIKLAAQQILGTFAGTPYFDKSRNSLTAFAALGHLILDISSEPVVNMPGQKEPLRIFTSLDITELRGYLVMWMFMSGTQSDLQAIKNTKIQFAPAAAEPTQKTAR
jgi:hypothetical protein